MVLRGGKRIRHIYAGAGTNWPVEQKTKIVRVGAAVELLHNYLMNLDDMADRDTVRHGGPTLEVVYAKSLFAHYPKDTREHYARTCPRLPVPFEYIYLRTHSNFRFLIGPDC